MPQCAVRHLRVAAASEPAARRFVTTLEDALRCATLPGDDRRVVVVRRLALGRVAHDAGTQRLGLLIEQRLARGEIAWADIDEPPAPRADAVGFAGPLEARVHLARRLAQGAPCDAWYWPLAVHEFHREQATRVALRCIARTIAAWPEARVALPAWVAQVVDAGGATALCAAIDERVACTLLREASIALAVDTDDVAAARPPARAGASARPDARARDAASPAPTLPTWLNAVLARARIGVHVHATLVAPPAARDRTPREASTALASVEGVRVADSTARVATTPPMALQAQPTALAGRTSTRSAQAPSSPISDSPPSHRLAPMTLIASGGDWHPTDCGGLLILLPVLQRAGLVQGESPDADRIAARRVLRVALRRVRAAEHDAAWALVADLPGLRPAESRAAEERARRELAAARRWLHRHARIGLVALVRRPARLALSATHVDVRFPLAGADLRVRRIGLDIDPGWLPWFGRVIAFQFIGRLP